MIGHYSFWNVLAFGIIVLFALLLDLHTHKADQPISMRNAALWSLFWLALSLGFAAFVGFSHGADDAYLFLAGYTLEKALSVDNLFVFIAIFSAFSIKDSLQHRVLYYGIVGALVLRLVFVALGTSVLLLFDKWALTAFGLFVLWSAWKMWRQSRQENEEVEDYSHHWAVRMTQKFIPVHPHLEGHNFFVRLNGIWRATPLFLCLMVIEIADVMFAFDSVPAVIAVTRDPFLVYTSNIFAILGLRSMYFLLAGANRLLAHLEKSVIAVLAFIGIKMLLDVAGVIHIAPLLSLAVVLGLLLCGIAASFLYPGK
ncbi:tellurium resistance protein TerC [Deltaproteobacteria bacterium]|nr:tellurium resistance protein TerC [Deltaproteobacteria bacterium]